MLVTLDFIEGFHSMGRHSFENHVISSINVKIMPNFVTVEFLLHKTSIKDIYMLHLNVSYWKKVSFMNPRGIISNTVQNIIVNYVSPNVENCLLFVHFSFLGMLLCKPGITAGLLPCCSKSTVCCLLLKTGNNFLCSCFQSSAVCTPRK